MRDQDQERGSRLLATWLLIVLVCAVFVCIVLVCAVFVWAVVTGPVAGSREEGWCRATGEDPVQGGKGGYVVLCKHPTGMLSVPREPEGGR